MPFVVNKHFRVKELTWYVVDIMVLGRSLLERVEERSRQGRLTVVKAGQLHHLKVGIFAPTENRREVRGDLTVIDTRQRDGEGGNGEVEVEAYTPLLNYFCLGT